MKRQKKAQVVRFPRHNMTFTPEELDGLTDALKQEGLFDFVQCTGIDPTRKFHTEWLETQDPAVFKKGVSALLDDLELYRRGILVLAKGSHHRGEAGLVALAAVSARLLAVTTTLFDLFGKIPDEPGHTSPSLGKSLQDGLNLYNRTVDQIYADAETEPEPRRDGGL